MILKPHEKFKLYRERKGLTQEGMGLKLGCSQMQISRIERGKQKPNDYQLEIIEKEFGTSIWTMKEKV
ncbi:transcriptional regulator with XRE-family HTH domain [Evansella vedderi]|uniref:Transcriptional regulator with XRE-family HTH domain n=1 Tax=Evansella vedderi TaxID=38282 RepID=A0ABT9ZXN1_9BACI|nr:helix-turn-helix transcriptional regulator [Evansella vedderi]MDQ0255492.1 transcriptional regulator with XRE-family HTH domain [Evansella vedderi]